MSTKLKAGTATSGAVIDADTAGILELQSGSTPTTAITIDASQNVGIGTASPATTLDIITQTSLRVADNATNATTKQGKLTTRHYTNAQADVMGAYVFSTATDNAVLLGGGSGSQNAATYVAVYTGATTTTTSGTERMRIDSSGQLLVATNSNPTTATTAQAFRIGPVATGVQMILSGTETTGYTKVSFNNGNGQVGVISTSGSSTSYVTSSDYRLKEDIAPMTGALDTVSKLKPVTYNWKVDGSSGQGFIAHELQAVVPECVTGEKDAVETVDELDAEGKVIGTKKVPKYQGIDTSFLVATLTASIQELKAIVDAQAERIAALEAK